MTNGKHPIFALITRLREMLSRLRDRRVLGDGSAKVIPPLMAELDAVETQISGDTPCQIALVGTTGAGKSTLLNALLGHEVLPVGVMQPCTSFVSRVRRHDGDGFRLQIRYATREEWRVEEDQLLLTLSGDTDTEAGDDPAGGNRLVRAARNKLAAVYGLDRKTFPDPFDPLAQKFDPVVETIFSDSSLQQHEFPTAQKLRAFLSPLVRDSSPVWPLISEVCISGPFSTLPAGVELVDLPGLNDPHRGRVENTRRFLGTVPNVWVVFSMKRGLTADVHSILHESRLLRRLILSGRYDALALVGTHADDIDADVAEALGLEADVPRSDLIEFYRQHARDEVRRQVGEMIEDMRQPGDPAETMSRLMAAADALPVFPTSARAFAQLAGLNPHLHSNHGIESVDATGVPELVTHLETIGRERGAAARFCSAARSLTDVCTELATAIRQHAVGVPPEARARASDRITSRLREIHVELDRVARTQAQGRFDAYRQTFLDGMQPAFRQATTGIAECCTRWTGLHWATLRAIVARDGCFVSPSNGREYDFNDDVCRPLLSQLPVRWEHFFTEQIGSVVNEMCSKVAHLIDGLTHEFDSIVDVSLPPGTRPPDAFAERLNTFREQSDYHRRKSAEIIAEHVRERRTLLAEGTYETAKARLAPAYQAAKTISGPGMKRRILELLGERAQQIAGPLHQSIEKDLTQGIADIWLRIDSELKTLVEQTIQRTAVLRDAALLEVEQPKIPPEAQAVLDDLDAVEAANQQVLASGANGSTEPLPSR